MLHLLYYFQRLKILTSETSMNSWNFRSKGFEDTPTCQIEVPPHPSFIIFSIFVDFDFPNPDRPYQRNIYSHHWISNPLKSLHPFIRTPRLLDIPEIPLTPPTYFLELAT